MPVLLMTELMNDAFSIQLCVLVEVHQGQCRHAPLSCHCRAQTVLETLHCNNILQVNDDVFITSKAKNISGQLLAIVGGYFVVPLLMWKHMRTASYGPVLPRFSERISLGYIVQHNDHHWFVWMNYGHKAQLI